MSGFPVTNNGPRDGYSGMAISGPLDGRFLTAQYEFWRVATLDRLDVIRPLRPEELDLPPEKPTIFVYKWVRGMRGETECDFWVPEDKDFSWALHVIFAAYADRGRA